MDFVFTVCDNAAGETCPVWPGQPMTAHWGIEDPAAVEGTDIQKEKAFVAAVRYLKNRISAFSNLPIRSLDKTSAQQLNCARSANSKGQQNPSRRPRDGCDHLSQPRLRDVAQHARHDPQSG